MNDLSSEQHKQNTAVKSPTTTRIRGPATKRILIVDDSDMIRETMTQLLVHEGYEVESAEDGDIGIKKFLSFKPDLILTDIYMPRVPGVHMIEEIRKGFPDVQIIVMSGGNARSQTNYDVDDGQGVYTTLNKPITRQKLIDAVAAALAA